MATTAQPGALSSFFSDVTTGLGQGLKEAAPRWVDKQLGTQSKNQLNQDTIDKSKQGQTLQDTGSTQKQTITEQIKAHPKMALAIVGVAGLLIFMVMKK